MEAEKERIKAELLKEYEARLTEAMEKPGHTLSEMEDAVTEVGKEMNRVLLERLVALKKKSTFASMPEMPKSVKKK